jgi:RHS repeat-associated protein
MEVSEAAAMRTDRSGRMLETVPGPGGDWSKGYDIIWDAWSRIVGVASIEGDTTTPVAAYAYDGIARRITRYTNAEDVTLHSYYNDEWRPLEERKDSESTAAASYLWGSRHWDDLVRRDRAVGGTTLNESRYVLMDYFSPAAITDEEGDVTERYQFSAFGLRTILNPDFTVRSDSECAMEFSFQGQFEDTETGWMNYGFRYYLPALGRWPCKDPLGERGGGNLYSMVGNDALGQVDFLGLAEHTTNQTESNRQTHEQGQARLNRDMQQSQENKPKPKGETRAQKQQRLRVEKNAYKQSQKYLKNSYKPGGGWCWWNLICFDGYAGNRRRRR